jgi:hypothetical protein
MPFEMPDVDIYPQGLLQFEAMITHYGSPNDEIIYKGEDEVIVAYVDSEATRDELKAQGLAHLTPGALYLADALPWPSSFKALRFDCKGWATRLAKRMQKKWDENPTEDNIPLFLQKKRKSWRVLLKEPN